MRQVYGGGWQLETGEGGCDCEGESWKRAGGANNMARWV